MNRDCVIKHCRWRAHSPRLLEAAIHVHRELGPGLWETVYEEEDHPPLRYEDAVKF